MFSELFTWSNWIFLCIIIYILFYYIEVVCDLPITGETPCSAHATLKSLIQSCIREAGALPQLEKFEDVSTTPDNTSDRTYEDLLATAIINKVIQNYQEAPGSSKYDKKPKKSENEYFLGNKRLDVDPDDVSSASSLEDWLRTDSRNEKFVDRLSLTIKHNPSSSSDEDESLNDIDEVDSINSQNVRNNEWQENWYLRKKQFDGTQSPVPVPMLVPNPTNEAKVFIGDREAEDTTDLSDAASDSEEVPEPTNLNMVLVNSKIIIGGRNPIESLVAKAESVIDDTSTDASDLAQEREDIVEKFTSLDNGNSITETSNDILVNTNKNVEDASLLSIDSNTEKDLEYTEKYATLPRTIYKTALKRQDKHDDELDYTDNVLLDDGKTDNVDSGVTSDEDDKQKSFKGSYSTREKEKWNHAIEMKNNPYSKANLEQRLSNRYPRNNSHSSEYFKKQASLPQGGSLDDSEAEVFKLSRSLSVDQVYKAMPCRGDDSFYAPKSPLSSDSDYSIERRYNLNTGKITNVIGNANKQLSTAEDVSDENHNSISKERDDYYYHKFNETRDVFANPNINTPNANHFQLVNDIANETSDQYYNEPISPPAEYKNIRNSELRKSLESINYVKSEPKMKRSLSLTLKSPRNERMELETTKLNNEIEFLKGSEIVKSRIQYFKSKEQKTNQPTSKIPLSEINEDIIEIKEVIPTSVYSLTARSIPTQFREKLKTEKERTNDVTEHDPVEESTVLFPNTKETIKLFENIAK